jgi:CheY-like chemotaxis protein
MNNTAALTILYVDDDSDDVDIFCDALRMIDQSITCMTARDGQEALKLLDRTAIKPDYIFLDINMPVMNGRQCLTELKKQQKLKHIPVVMYSTTTNALEKTQCFKLGAYKFLIKQDSYAKLCRELAEILGVNRPKSLN